MPNEYKVYLEDILQAIGKIETYTQNMSWEDFQENEMAIDAVIRNLEVIGEAVKNIPTEIKKNRPEIEWRKIAGLRDILAHEYFGVDLRIVWDVIINKIQD